MGDIIISGNAIQAVMAEAVVKGIAWDEIIITTKDQTD